MAQFKQGPASTVVTLCQNCKAKIITHVLTVGNVRCSGCGKTTRVRK